MSARRTVALAAALAAAALALPELRARAQEEPGKPAPAAPAAKPAVSPKEAKVRRLLEVVHWDEQVVAGMDASFEEQIRMGRLPKEFPARFKKIADMDALRDLAVAAWTKVYDEETLDAALAFLQTPPGQKYVKGQLAILPEVMEKVQPWAMEAAMKTMQSLMDDPPEDEGADGEEDPLLPNLQRARISADETSAIATLRNLASCQAQIQTSGKIDCDRDGIGEYGTFLELTGAVAVRNGRVEARGESGARTPAASDFSARGTAVNPPILSPRLAEVGKDGAVAKSGYRFRIYLPDAGSPAGFAHETGPKGEVGVAGGTGTIGIDLAETAWCAYAWPEKRGGTGNRAFFVNQSGDVMQCANDRAQWDGEKGPPGSAAFLGAGITSPVAVGTAGSDGEIWKVTN